MNFEEAFRILHPHIPLPMNPKAVINLLKTEAEQLGFEIRCSEITVEQHHSWFIAETSAVCPEDRHYAEFIVWNNDGVVIVEESGWTSCEATRDVIKLMAKRWAPQQEEEPEMSPYHTNSQRIET